MTQQPTLIVLAAKPSAGPTPVSVHSIELLWRRLSMLAERAADSGLPTVCVLPYGMKPGGATLPASCWVLEQPRPSADGSGSLHTLARAVQATAQSPGWLYQPATAPIPDTTTLQLLALAVQQHPLVVPTHEGLPCHPVGFGSEFYSELSRLKHEQDIQRLLARYPAVDIAIRVSEAALPPPRQTGRPLALSRQS